MILKSVKLENIRSYTSQSIEFPEGSVLLNGDIGSGKSTVLLAAEFALFGIMRPSLSGTALLRKGKNQGSVELRFELHGKDIIVRRGLKRTKDAVQQDTGFVIVDGVKTEGTAVELKTKILDMLGYPKDLVSRSKSLIYRYTVYTPQEEMKRILFEDSEQRLDTLRKVFGIDKYKRINENAAVYVKKLKDKAKHFSAKTEDLESKKKQAEEKQEEKNLLQQKNNALQPDIEAIQKKRKEKRQQIESIEKNVQKLNELKHKLGVADAKLAEKVQQAGSKKQELEQLDLNIRTVSEKLEALEEKTATPIEKSEQEIENSITEKEKQLHELLSATIQLKEKTAQLAQLEKQLLEKRKHAEKLPEKEKRLEQVQKEITDKESIEKEIKKNESLLIELNSAIRQAEQSITELQNRKEKIKHLFKCPLCQQKVDDNHKASITDESETKITAHKLEMQKKHEEKRFVEAKFDHAKHRFKDILEKQAVLEGLKSELASLKNIEQEVRHLQYEFEQLEDKKQRLERSLKENPDDIKEQIAKEKTLLKQVQEAGALQKEKENLKELLKEKEDKKELIINNIADIKKEIGRINTEKMQFNEEIAGMKDIELKLSTQKCEFELIDKEEKKLLIQKAEIDKEIQGVQNFIDSLQKEIDEKQELKKKLLKTRSLQEFLETHFMNLMNTIEKHVMMKVYSEFNDTFTKWFNTIIDDETISVKLDETFSPTIIQNGYETELENLSGGEKTAVALAYRLSLNKVINDVIGEIKTKDLIILDEPTDGFSTEQLDKVRDVLDELDIKQIVLVSHESKIESFVDNIVRIVKNEHESQVL